MRLAAMRLPMLLRILLWILGPRLSPPLASTLSPLFGPKLSLLLPAPRLSSRLASVLLSMLLWILGSMRRRPQNIGSRLRGPRPPRAERVAHTPDPDKSPCTQMHGREIWFRCARARTVSVSG